MDIREATKLVGYGIIMAALPIFLWGCLMTAVLQTGALGAIILYSGLVSLLGYVLTKVQGFKTLLATRYRLGGREMITERDVVFVAALIVAFAIALYATYKLPIVA